MADPVTLDPVPSNQSGATFALNNTDDAIQQRALSMILSLKERFPSRFKRWNIWHPVQVQQTVGKPVFTLWVRVAERVEIAFTERHDRWFQEKLGIFHHKVQEAVIPVGFRLHAQDELIEYASTESYAVIDVVNQSGVEKAMINNAQSKFVKPLPSKGTTRMLIMGAIVGEAGTCDTGSGLLPPEVSTSGTWVVDEVPAGAIDGTNTVFIFKGTPKVLILQLFGLTLAEGQQYTRSGNTVTLMSAPSPDSAWANPLVGTYQE